MGDDLLHSWKSTYNLTPLKQLLIAYCWLEALHNSIHSGLTQILYIIYSILIIKQAKEEKCY